MEYRGHTVYVLHFDHPVSRPQTDHPVGYLEASWRYYYHNGQQRSLDHWCGLPSAPYDPTSTLISEDTLGFVRAILQPVDVTLCNLVIDIFTCLNEMQKHGAFTTPEGIWNVDDALKPLPNIIPASKPANPSAFISAYLRELWVQPTYALSSYAALKAGFPPNSTMEHFFSWLDSVFGSSFVHKPSGTLQGGDAGSVWLAVSLVRFVLNTSIATLKATVHEDPPDSLDLERLGTEHPKLVSYLHQLHARLKASLEILSASSSERVHVAEAILSSPEATDSNDELDDVVPAPGPSPEATLPSAAPAGGAKRKRAASKHTVAKPKRSDKKGKQPARSQALPSLGGKLARRKTFSALNDSDAEHVISSREDSPAPPPPSVIIDHAWFEPRDNLADFSQRHHVFGRFAAQPDVPAHNGTPHDILIDLHNCLRDVKTALAAWRAFDASFHAYPGTAIRHATELSKRDPRVRLRPVLAGILLHRFCFNRSQSLWPKVVELTQPIFLVVRKLTTILKTVDSIVEERSIGPARKKLLGSRPSIIQATIECRAVVEVLAGMENLCTSKANLMEDAWQKDLSSMDVGAVMSLARFIGDWRTETAQLATDFRQIYVHYYIAHEIEGGLPEPIRYRVGCPDEDVYDGDTNGKCFGSFPTLTLTMQTGLLMRYGKGPYDDLQYIEEEDTMEAATNGQTPLPLDEALRPSSAVLAPGDGATNGSTITSDNSRSIGTSGTVRHGGQAPTDETSRPDSFARNVAAPTIGRNTVGPTTESISNIAPDDQSSDGPIIATPAPTPLPLADRETTTATKHGEEPGVEPRAGAPAIDQSTNSRSASGGIETPPPTSTSSVGEAG
ncbi:hypothetical protein FRC06_009069, partial [Ceratobasidium sp. 370]